MARSDGPWRAVRGACSRICCRVASPRSIRLNSHWPDTRIVSADLGTRPRRAHPKANVGMEYGARSIGRIERIPGRAGPGIGTRCKNFAWRGLLFDACQGTIEGCTRIAWSSTVMTDLETKAEKYKTKAARCEEWALQAPVGPQRHLYEVLAHWQRTSGKSSKNVRPRSSTASFSISVLRLSPLRVRSVCTARSNAVRACAILASLKYARLAYVVI